MKAVIIGATGLVGEQLVKQLLSRSEFSEVVVFGRRETGLEHPKLREETVNFNQVENWASKVKGDVLFSCLGTTIKKAGSQENQFKIDYTFQFVTAEAAARNKVAHYVLVSSSGANANSPIFYSRMKGQLEEAVLQLPFRKITILRPSLLLGERKEKRGGEAFAQKVMPAITRYVFRKYRPIPAATVARAMLQAAIHPTPKIVFGLDEIFELAQ